MGRRWVWIVMFSSLALNLFLVGLMAGALVIGSRFHVLRPQGAGPQPVRGLWAAGSGLTPEHRQAFHKVLRGGGQDVGAKLREARQLRRQAWTQMGAEPLDPAAATQSLDRARALETEARGGVEHEIVTFAATLPPAERAALAEGLARTMSPPRGQGRMPGMERPNGPRQGPAGPPEAPQ